MCGNREEVISRIDALLADDMVGNNGLTIRHVDVPNPRILGVFTGQGAQWPRMGAELIKQSPYVAERISELERALSSLPEGDRPAWSLRDELLADAQVSRLSEAAIAQPLCTAIQIILVDLFRAANIKLSAVVGHSSGEIGAAYAAGFLSATNAIRVAYYRGLFAHLARSESGVAGAMVAIGTSIEDAVEFCELEEFHGRIQVAARNSSTSITLSGDEDAVDEAEAIFKDESKFARKLKVDTAYHSHHMLPCAAPYLDALARCGITVDEGNGIPWFSSVVEGQAVIKENFSPSQYWVDNMTNTVLFAPAIEMAMAHVESFDMAIEFGPHPALKGPSLDTIEAAAGKKIPYIGLLGRGKNDVNELALAVGTVWTQLGSASVNFDQFERQISGASVLTRRVLTDLPTYPFDHVRQFYSLTRSSGGFRNVHAKLHPLLGRRCIETETDSEISWRQLLRPHEIRWLHGHQLQGQLVFPAMGYVAMAVEAAVVVASTSHGRKIGLISLQDVVIDRAITFGEQDSGVECKITMTVISFTIDELSARITIHSGLPFDAATPLALNFSATVKVMFHEPASDTLPASRVDEINLVDAQPERLYSQFTSLGYNYSSPFTAVRAIHRKMDFATGDLEDESEDNWEDQLLVHPGFLDSALQTGFAAYSHPHDKRLWALYVPTYIRSIVINPFFLPTHGTERTRSFQYQSASRDTPEMPMVVDVDIFAGEGQAHPFVQFDTVGLKPFAAAGPRDDSIVFSRCYYKLATVDAAAAIVGGDEMLLPENAGMLVAAERIGFFYLRRLYESITPEEKANTLSHYQRLLENASRLMDVVKLGQHPTVPREAMTDSSTYIRSLISKYHQRIFVQLLEVVGEHLEEEVRRNGTMLEHMMKDGLLDQFYEELAGPRGVEAANTWYGRLVAQIAHRYPRMHLFEIGAGTGGATRDLLPTLGTAFASYTYTDISAGFFERAQQSFADYSDRMVFATYDMERPPAEQGFEEGSYDIVLAAAVLHVTGKLDEMMANIRRLLKPGGYLIVVDIINNDFLSIGTIMGGLPGWWAGAEVDSNRSHGPCLSIDQWDALSRKHGFGGVDTHTPTDHKLQYYSVFACQAVDERVVSLRNPLAAPAPALASSPAPAATATATATLYPRHLVVVGGRKVATAQLAEETCALLSGRYEKITRIDSLEELHVVGLAPGSSVLSLTELDQQYLEVRSAAKLEALKTLWRNGRSILYVTRGAQAESPYSAILLGLSRVVRFEYPNINMQILDFDAATTPSSKILAESLLRLELGYQWKREEEGVNLLWSLEPELHYVEGQPLIPRVYPIVDANRRYNTSRRTIRAKVSPREETVVLDTTPNGKAFELSTVSPLRVVSAPRTKKTVTLQVQTSLLWAVKVHEAGFFSLCIGEDVETSEQVIALVDTAVESLVRVPLEWTARTSGESLAGLGSIAVHLLTQSILAAAPRSGIMLVHEADEVLKDALEREAAMEGVQILFTTAVKKPKTKSSSPSQFVHTKLPMRMVQRLVPRQTSLFINFSPACEAGKLLVHCLPSSTPTYTTEDFLCARPGAYVNVNVDQVGRALKVACQTVPMQRRATSQRECLPVVSLQDVVGLSTVNAKLSVVDWKSPSVEVSLRPIDHGTIFRADGTYLLFGLAGELGQSLCTWMVAHGARHIMIGSRRPRVDPRFIESLAIQGANIRVMEVDITSRESLRSCYHTICAEMPQIIGVANGALVLEDSLFDDLEFESLQRTSPPKIEGSLLLDELFYDTPLDFFVLFTSAVNLMGNTGQSSYIMANQFMTALAAQRREIRGVVGSDMALAAVSGLGFFEHADLDKDHFTKMGYQNASEQDFHQQFAETVLVGRPRGDKGISQVVTGLAPFRLTPHIQAQLREDPKFGHYILQDAGALRLAGGDGGGSTARARVRLAGVTTRSEASTVVREAFMQRLKRILMIPLDEAVNETITFVEQGVDSIMAVEIRTWFLSELEVDIPVLKILGAGSTIQVLLDEAMGKIPASILDWEKLVEGGNDNQTNVKPAAPSVTAETISSPTLSSASLTTPETPPDMGTSTPTSITATDTTSTSSMEIKPAVFLVPATSAKTPETNELSQALQWRNQIVESSTEHKEQMTYGQSRFWFLTHYVDDPTTFNGAFMFKLTGPIRVKDLARAVETVGQRHEALRTRFFWSDDESKTPMQGILSKSLVRLETARIKSEAEAVMNLEAMRDYVWDLGDWIPARLRLLSISDTLHYFLLGTHHISVDGHSFTVMMMEIDHAYSNPHRPLPPMPVTSQARAFGAHQLAAYQSGRFQPAIDFYRRMLPPRDLTRPIELFSFARTQLRTPLDRYETHVTRRVLDPSTVAKLKQLARGRRSTSFHVYLAAFQAMLFHLLPADTTDKVFIGMADANRIDSNFMGSVGNFLNVLPLRFDRASRRQTFGEAVEAARTKVYSALEHSALPFDLLLDELAVPRSNTWPPVFQVFVDYRLISNQQADPTWAGCRRSEEKWFPSRSSYDVVLEIAEDGDETTLGMHVQKALYDVHGSELLLSSYMNILRAVAKQGDKLRIEMLEIWDEDECKRALEVGNGMC
jgi:hybrid polyketide synthase/nonribosomal peptide synthetase ACE1